MKQYRVTFEIYKGDGTFERRIVTVEAGNKKNAYGRALSQLSKEKAYESYYKKITAIEEVA